MRKYKFVSKEVEEEVSRTCNKCGMEYSFGTDVMEEWQAETIRDMKIVFGYGDPSDGVTLKFDICDKCMHDWVDSFKIPAEESF